MTTRVHSLPKLTRGIWPGTLGAGHWSGPSAELCAMAVVAWVAEERHSDEPRCASPVLAQFVRAGNDAMADHVRQVLALRLHRLADSRDDAAEPARAAILLHGALVAAVAVLAEWRPAAADLLADAERARPEPKIIRRIARAAVAQMPGGETRGPDAMGYLWLALRRIEKNADARARPTDLADAAACAFLSLGMAVGYQRGGADRYLWRWDAKFSAAWCHTLDQALAAGRTGAPWTRDRIAAAYARLTAKPYQPAGR